MEHPSSTSHAAQAQAGDLVDLAQFARLRWWSGSEPYDLEAHELAPHPDGLVRPASDPENGEWHAGLEWDEPRDVRRVVVCYAGASGVPPNTRVEYWRRNWPTPAPERRPGPGAAGLAATTRGTGSGLLSGAKGG